jgi:hypothetical protein
MVPRNRYEIEELLHQDADGVVFLARDRETGELLHLQRFFPFGAEERGLAGAEVEAFSLGVLRLQELRHPGLISILGGACDPNDGMPYLVASARTGKTLADYLAHAALTIEQARWLAEEILRLMDWMAQQIGHEVNWLHLNTFDIELVEDEQQGVSFRFAIDPMKWLDRRAKSAFFSEFAALLEQALGWSGRTLTTGNAGPFSQWLKKIKTSGMTIPQALVSLTEEEVTQHIPLRTSDSVPPRPLAPKHPPLASAQKNSHTGWYAIAALIVIGGLAVGAVKWWNERETPSIAAKPRAKSVTKQLDAAPSKKPAAALDEKQKLAEIERRARELQGSAAASSVKKAPRAGDYRPHEGKALRQHMNEKVSVSEKLARIRLSSSKKTIYLEFGGSGAKAPQVCGRYLVINQSPGMNEAELNKLKGRKIRITGIVKEEFGSKRLVIDLTERSQIGGAD